MPCGVPELGHGSLDLAFYALRSYSLINPPRTGQRLIGELKQHIRPPPQAPIPGRAEPRPPPGGHINPRTRR